MSVAIVQHTNYSSAAATSGTATLVFTSGATAGNILLVSMSLAFTKLPTVAPTGWTRLVDYTVGGNAAASTFYHQVQNSETNSYAFTTNGADFLSAVGYEISGAAFPKSFGLYANNTSTGTTTLASPSMTPNFDSEQAICFFAQNDGASAGAYGDTVSGSWTIDEHPYPNFHSMVGSSMNSLTSGSAVSTTFTGLSSNNICTMVLLKSPSPGTFVKLNAGLRPHPFSPGLAR